MAGEPHEPHARPPRRWTLWRVLLGGVIISLCAAGATATFLLLQVKESVDVFMRAAGPEGRIPGIRDTLDRVDPGDARTVLLLGSDRRWSDKRTGSPARSDTILLVRLDPDADATRVLSIPRDLKVTIDAPDGPVTAKINEAYALGGPKLTVATVRDVLGVPVHHVASVEFRGFRDLVDALGCVYTDVDRRYFNDNRPPAGGGAPYATIDVPAGYQKLCGPDALDYVRYRHTDTDIVRGARQQDFLRQVKDQVAASDLTARRNDLLAALGRNTQTDVRSTGEVLSLIKLATAAADKPVRQVHLDVQIGPSYVTSTRQQLQAAAGELLGRRPAPEDTGGAAGPQHASPASSERAGALGGHGTVAAADAATVGRQLARRARMRVYAPRLAAPGARVASSDSRAYTLRDEQGRRRDAYRVVVELPASGAGTLGQFYGVQGTTWTDPPILSGPHEVRTVRGRHLLLFHTGKRLRLVAWRTRSGAYWVSNTLLRSLTNRQMIMIARSLQHTG